MGTLPPFLLKNSTVSFRKSIWEHPAGRITVCSGFSASSAIQENWMITDGALIGRIHLEPTLDISGKTPSVSLRIGNKKCMS